MIHDLIARNDKIIIKFPVISEFTPSGVQKGKLSIEAEQKERGNLPMEVYSVGSKVSNVQPGDFILVLPKEITILDSYKTGSSEFNYALINDYQAVAVVKTSTDSIEAE